jgi:3-isopropylmalate dehydrogenase
MVDKLMFLKLRVYGEVKTVSESYPDVALEFLFVDNAAMQIILNPRQFDVILTENLFVIFYLTKQV